MTAGTRQLAIDWEPGLVEQWRGDDGFAELVNVCVHASRANVGGLAIACDRSPSLVSKQLGSHREEDATARRHFPLMDFPKVLRVTGDLRPLYRLIEEFLDDRTPVSAIDAEIAEHMAALARLHEQRQRQAWRGAK